jgi:hypothetical protein
MSIKKGSPKLPFLLSGLALCRSVAAAAATAAAVRFLKVRFDGVPCTAGCFNEIDLDGFHVFQKRLLNHEGQPVLVENLVAVA